MSRSEQTIGFRITWPWRLRRRILQWCRRNLHFVVAAAILVLTLAATRAIGWTEKLPVPWPAGVRVSPDFRLESMPAEVGPFALAEDGELSRKGPAGPVKDGRPDGDLVFKEDELRTLGIGTSYDKGRYELRSSNWYAARIYRDTRIKDAHSPYAYWRLEVYYYTGVPDKVPHVPERCLTAGGVKVTGSENVTVRVPEAPADRPAWQEFQMRRVRYQSSSPQGALRGVEYYVFSLNGSPETSWEFVRLNILSPLVQYCYFAKVQFSPMGTGEIGEFSESDAAAEGFLNAFLPVVLKALPSTVDVGRLGAIGAAGK